MSTKHTKTPWEVVAGDGGHTYIMSNGRFVADTGCRHTYSGEVQPEIDAQFIVTACNMHEELVRFVVKVGEYRAPGDKLHLMALELAGLRELATAILAKLPKEEK